MNRVPKKNSGSFKHSIAFLLARTLSGAVVTMNNNGLDVTLTTDSGKTVAIHIYYLVGVQPNGSYYDYWFVTCPEIEKQTMIHYHTDGKNDNMHKRIVKAVVDMKELI